MTLWHVCTPSKHATDCQECLTIQANRPKTDSGNVLYEFHPPYGRAEEVGTEVSTEEALRWPHIISYS
jgi:hypothetical protein